MPPGSGANRDGRAWINIDYQLLSDHDRPRNYVSHRTDNKSTGAQSGVAAAFRKIGYVAAHWDEDGGRWHFHPGHWER
jgi:hypothetical protein